jgi:hypothetical protein
VQANDFLIALRMRAEHGTMIKKLCDFKERHITSKKQKRAKIPKLGPCVAFWRMIA